MYVILAALCWGLHGALAKFLFSDDLTPATLVQFRLVIATVLFFLGILLFKRRLFVIQLRDLPYFMVCGVVGISINFFLYYYAIRAVSVAMGIFLQYLAPSVIAIYWMCRGKKPTGAVISAIIVSLLGCFLVVKAYDVNFIDLNILGIAAGVAAAVAWASQSLIAEELTQRYNPLTVILYSFLCATLFWNIIYSPRHMLSVQLTMKNCAGILYVAIFGTIVPYMLFYKGIQMMRATRASVIATIEPVAAAVFAYFLLGESLQVPQILGGCLVVGSIMLLQMRSKVGEVCEYLP
ncbi:MAG: hypothetical protein COV45_06380 [Deltaproteobacteria bacterium CG11_big_fil_rev_8_21_14_0_20_47_16]|nr:MAG: hypothetical protein COV45_06380 [Deltaproteobacteria bacterium CG11_big_fil_rev_8_21_14_0_20_47_16]